MNPARRMLGALRRLRAIVGTPGLLIALFALLSFGYGLYVLASEYNRPRQAARCAPPAAPRLGPRPQHARPVAHR